METINILIFLVALGFLAIGVIFLTNKSIRSSIETMKTYKDANKYFRVNGSINIISAILIVFLNIIDIVLKTNYELYIILPIIILTSFITNIFNKTIKK